MCFVFLAFAFGSYAVENTCSFFPFPFFFFSLLLSCFVSAACPGRGHDVPGRRRHGGDRHAHGLLPGERQDPQGGVERSESNLNLVCLVVFVCACVACGFLLSW